MKKTPHLKIDSKHLILRNNPTLAKLFAREDLQELLKRILEDIENPYQLKKFLKLGPQSFYDGIIGQLKNSYEIISSKKEDAITVLVLKLRRSFDRKVFSIGDTVTVIERIKEYDREGYEQNVTFKEWSAPIGRMYCKVNDDDLKIRLDLPDKSLTWRSLSQLK